MKIQKNINANDSITPSKILRNPALKQYKVLLKMWGVHIEAYRPKTLNPQNTLHGFQDDSNEFETNAYYVGKAIIPSIFRRRSAITLANLDPFIDSDKYLYIPDDVELTIYSLIICKLQSNKILNFRINDIDEDGNDAGAIVKRYALVPYVSVRPKENLTQIQSHLEAELQTNNISDSITNNSNESYKNTQSNDFLYKPLE